jgi:transposase
MAESPEKFVEKFLDGKKCFFCGKYGLYRLADRRVKCKSCKRVYSLGKLSRDIEVLRYFTLELSANRCASELGLSYNTVRNRYMLFRSKIAEHSEKNFKKLGGEIEVDETYFGGRKKGKRGRGSRNKVVVLGILERNGKVYTKVIPDIKAETLMNIVKEKTEKGSVYFTDCYRSYKSLKRYGKHHRINKDKAFAKGRNHINGIEGFWSFAKERFHKYHGVNKQNYPLYLKELEFRFNNRNTNIFKKIFNIIYTQISTKIH